MRRAITVEMLKLRRATVVRITTVLIAVATPLLSAAMVAVAGSGGAGAGAVKAQALVVGEGWEAYLGLFGQMVAVAMFIGPGIVATWSFGREFTDRTFPSLYALAVSRRAIAAAKFIVLAGWGLLMSVTVVAGGVLVGVIARVGAAGDADLIPSLARLAVAALLTSMLALTVGLVASVGRGYLPGVGAVIVLTMLAQLAVLFGTGGWFPYAAPGLYAMAGGEGIPEVSGLQLLQAPATSLLAAWLTIRWWGRAEAT